jgi:hypothetical protein
MGEINLTEEQQRILAYQNYNRTLRSLKYPPVEEQLDMIWNDMNRGSLEGINTEFYNTILQVKQQYPKPE